jgi:nucleoside-triphosphatase THEP1
MRSTVLEALAGERPVIAAVKEKKTPFLDAVRESAGALVVHVTEENRETLFEQLLPLVRSWEK